jgi:(2R)-3-sulfolactate dehydrogenase (NADP+)
VGQTLIAIHPDALGGASFAERIETLLGAVLGQPGTRLPGADKPMRRTQAARDGLSIPAPLLAELAGLAAIAQNAPR